MTSGFRLTYLLGGVRCLRRRDFPWKLLQRGLKGRRIETIMPDIVDP